MTIAVPADTAWDAEEEFAKLAATTCLDLNDIAEGNGDKLLRASDDFVLLRGEQQLNSNNQRANDWLMLNHRVPLGFPKSILSSVPLSSADVIWLADKLAMPKEWIFAWGYGDSWGYSDSSPTEHSWEPMRRWHALAKQLCEPCGAKSVNHLEVLRQSDPTPGSLFPRKLRATATEVSYDPIDRYNALAKQLREPRGAKSVNHLEVLRQSDPTPGSLFPRKLRATATEVSYDPIDRYNALAKQLREPRGTKRFEHLEALRQSDPTPGSLFPRKLRATATEVSYDPIDRWTSLSRYLREPRGTKSFEHLKALREAPAAAERQWTERGPAAGWLKAELLDLQQELPPLVGLPANVSAPCLDQTASPDNGEEEEEASTQSGDSWQVLKPSGPRLPRILSNQVLDMLHDEEDFGLAEDSQFSLASRSGRLPISYASRSTSFDSDDLEDESLRSAALTGYERPTRSSERCSNDTIGSFLDDASDSGSLPATPRSPARGGERGPVWAPPKGTFKDAEMAARVAAKANSSNAEEIKSGVAATYRSTGFKVSPAKGAKEAKDPMFAKDAKEAVGKDLSRRAAPRAQLF